MIYPVTGHPKIRWYNSLYSRLAIGLSAILFLMGIIFAIFTITFLEHQSVSDHQQLNRNLAEKLVHYRRMVIDGRVNHTALKETFNEYMEINPGIEIYHLDTNGQIKTFSADPGKVLRDNVDINPIKQFLSNDGMYPLMGDNPRTLDDLTAFSVAAIPHKDNPESYLYVILKNPLGTDTTAKQLHRYVTLGAGVVAATLLFGLFSGLVLFRHSTVRLKTLQKKVNNLANNGFKKPNPASSPIKKSINEIDSLENHIDKMTQTIAHQWSALKQQDSLRREMVANISHDLRTPLASLQGYLETLVLKSESLNKQQRSQYLNITLKQARRLRKLIDDLFELAKLDNPVTQPAFESFSITELVFDVADKLSMRAGEKNIRIKVKAPEDNIIVYADISMIERVLDNLIQNALRYTATDGSISISVTVNDSQLIEVAVHDSGTGIASEQQAMIFERFHQADNPHRTGNTAGLGLAISNKIIELHRQKIWVDSHLGKGSSFYFTLQGLPV